MEQWIKR